MSYVISIVTSLIVLILTGCTIESFLQKNKISRALGIFELVSIVSIVSCLLIYMMPNVVTARLMLGLYCFSMDYALFTLTNYIFSYETSSESDVGKIIRYAYIVLTVIDAIFLFTSSYTGLCFNVDPYVLPSGKETWIITFNNAIIFHLGLCYALSTFIFIRTIRTAFQISPFYRPRFILIFILFMLEFSANLIFIIFPHYWVFDFSSIIYGILVIVCFSITVYSVPKDTKKRILKIASESISDAVICFDYRGKCIYINETAKFYFNADNDEWIYPFLKYDGDFLIKTIVLNINEEAHTCKVEYRRFYDKRKKLLGSYIKLNDFSEEIKKIEREEYRASHDSLTGLLNREYFFKEAQKILSSEPLVPRYLVCTDIKNFKLFNELFGADYGDRILKMQAEMLSKANYDKVVHGRISGDKFAMLIKQRNFKPELAIKNTECILNLTKDIHFPLTVYIGVYEIKDTNENVRSMYDKAYMAIKNIDEGENTRVAYYDSKILEKLMEEKNIISRFDVAIKNNQFKFYLQSQVDSKTKECCGAEALVRWDFPEKGILAPSAYINVLEKSGQIYKLDQYVWEEVIKLLRNWKDRGIDKYISINVSVKDFYYIDIYEVITKLVEKYDVSPSKLNIEITESVFSHNNPLYREIVNKLQNYGFKIEMDDFGSGYSSLNLLKDISMNVLKIDMGFLEVTENSDRALLIINSITKMAKSLGMQIIAEGVETEEQTEMLVKANVDVFQGYLYSHPIPVEEFEKKYLGGKK